MLSIYQVLDLKNEIEKFKYYLIKNILGIYLSLLY